MTEENPELVYHVRHYSGNTTRDVIHSTLSKAKNWVEYRSSEEESVDWKEHPTGCWKGVSSQGPQIGEIHRRRIGDEFDRF